MFSRDKRQNKEEVTKEQRDASRRTKYIGRVNERTNKRKSVWYWYVANAAAGVAIHKVDQSRMHKARGKNRETRALSPLPLRCRAVHSAVR